MPTLATLQQTEMDIHVPLKPGAYGVEAKLGKNINFKNKIYQ